MITVWWHRREINAETLIIHIVLRNVDRLTKANKSCVLSEYIRVLHKFLIEPILKQCTTDPSLLGWNICNLENVSIA